jgi:hypothetical protein
MVILPSRKANPASLQPSRPTTIDTIPPTPTDLDNPLADVDDMLTLDDIPKYILLSVSLLLL